IRAVDGAAVVSEQERGVDGGGIAIELHADAQAVLEDGGDERALLGQLAFLFDQRSQGDHFVYGPGGVDASPGVAELAGHEAAEFVGGGVAGEAGGVGGEIPFERGGQGIEIVNQGGIGGGCQEIGGLEEAELFGGGSDIEHVLAFGHHQLQIEDVAARDSAKDVHGGGGVVEAVFAGLQNM